MNILFQGDSITDAGRAGDGVSDLGGGYPRLVQASLGFDEPGEHTFTNFGISGNRIVDLYARIRNNIINVKPDVMSILIGVNDVWHEFAESPNGVDAEKFFRIYDMLITEVKEALPAIKIMILEPFALREYGNDAYYDTFRAEVGLRAAAARRIAEKHGLTFVPLQAGFDELEKKAPAAYWLCDGVHPTPMGHEFIKREWLRAYKTL